MISLRHNGESLPETIGRYLGVTTKQIMRGFTVILMILVGAVFVAGPAELLAMLTPESLDSTFWIYVVFIYYIIATLFPIDKIIGRVYPFLLPHCSLWRLEYLPYYSFSFLPYPKSPTDYKTNIRMQ